jgi:hypothetical protein
LAAITSKNLQQSVSWVRLRADNAGIGLFIAAGNWENLHTMKKFMLRRLGVAHEPGSFKPSLQDCIEAVLEQSDTLVDDVLSGLKASLSQTRSKSVQVVPNPSTKATIERLYADGKAVKATFAEKLRGALYGGETHRAQSQPLRFDDFQFLEEEQIDANIEFALTQQEISMAVDDALPPLDALMSSLLGWMTVQPLSNPLKPEGFVYALRETLVEHVPSDEARTSLMTPAAGMLGVAMRQLYKEVSEWLRSQGVEPVGPIQHQGAAHGSQKTTENSVTRTLLTLDKLRRLLSGELDMGPLNGNIKDFTHTVPASFVALEDMKLMEPMMKRLQERASQAAAAAPKGVVKDMLEGEPSDPRQRSKSKKLGRELGEEVVRMMLENLSQDHRMLGGVRKNLKLMEPVLIALSQSDARFFSERQHPARQFMDKMTSRSLAFTSEDQPGFAHFQRTLEKSVHILANGPGDAATFAQVLKKLEAVWAKEEYEQRQRAEEAARGLLHAEQRNMLALRLAEDFAERLKNKKVPDIVGAFLRGPWAQVVAESQLRCSDGTVDGDGYLALVDDLIWSVQLKLARRNRSRLVDIVPGMLVKMRQGLGLISYPEERIPVFFDELITFHEQAFEGARPAPSADVPDKAAPADISAVDSVGLPVDEFWMAEDEATDSGFLQGGPERIPEVEEDEVPDPAAQMAWSAQSLITGSWVDLALGGQWVRAQLTWASPHKTLFMFISSGGMAHSMSRRTMDRLRGLGLIRLVSDGRVIDHALDAVAQAALRNDVEKAGGAGQ